MNSLSFLFDVVRIPNLFYRFSGDEKLAYELSEQAYKNPNERSGALLDWRLDMSSSDEYKVVYRRGDESIIGFRGTRLNDNNDIVSDLNIGTNTESFNPRFNSSLQFVNSQSNVKFITGHSLGGSISRYISSKTGKQAYTFNAGSSPLIPSGTLKSSKDFVISMDAISKNITNTKENLIVGRPTSYNPHSLNNFQQFNR
jgi:hypothetical protein